MLTKSKITAYISLILCQPIWSSEQTDPVSLPALELIVPKTANTRPVATYETPISNLDFDPRVDMQARNMAEAQGDLSIRGGTFENTGIQVGTTTLLDPQTGHYTTELPIAPEMLGEPNIVTGAENALLGFNSGVGTVSYSWSEITKGGSLNIGGGDHDLNFQRLHNAWTGFYNDSEVWIWGAEIEGSRSESVGTLTYGDHDFSRTSGRIQLLGPDSQTDFFAGYQEKFFGWPGMYTANYNNHETEDIGTTLFLINHRKTYLEGSEYEVSAFHRANTDHYTWKRESPSSYEAFHETEVNGLGIKGRHQFSDVFALRYFSQITSDSIDTYTTSGGTRYLGLDRGKFTSRNYYKLSLMPEFQHQLNEKEVVQLQIGASWDDTNRNKSRISPIFEISHTHSDSPTRTSRTYLSFAESSQVVGYSAIGGSENSGLFRSNYELDREISKTIEIGHLISDSSWRIDTRLFYRWDDDLTDWTYFVGDVNRTANPVDTQTFGVEIIGYHKWQNFQLIGSYAYLSKDEDYKKPDFVGSFYALNYPEHRATLGIIWEATDLIQIRVDNEWREQRENLIRTGPDDLFYSHLAISYFPSQISDTELFLAYDKPWDEEFQDLPGTPGRGDQFSFGVSYRW